MGVRRLALALSVVLLLAFPTSAIPQALSLEAKVEQATVFLMNERYQCSGFWLGPSIVMTAAHCFEKDKELVLLIGDKNDHVVAMTIYRRDAVKDLALGTAYGGLHGGWFTARYVEPEVGMEVVVGSSRATGFDFKRGRVVGILRCINRLDARPNEVHFSCGLPVESSDQIVVIEASVGRGDSGSAAYDTDGNLVGMFVALRDLPDGTRLGYFIGSETIKKFLGSEK